MQKTAQVYKILGETPLQAIERFRSTQIALARADTNMDLAKQWEETPLTYAGRLDPLAEGELLILIGDECKGKDKYLSLDKEYEVEIVFGFETDTYDVLGMVTTTAGGRLGDFNQTKYEGTFVQEYPPYSSKTVGGTALHELAREDALPDELPTKQVTIRSIEVIGCYQISAEELKARILGSIELVTGDFRQKEISTAWEQAFKGLPHFSGTEDNYIFDVLKIRVRCSSGAYMRSLAHRIGIDAGTGAIALSIKRTQIIGG